MPSRDITCWASGCRLCGRDLEGDLGLGIVNAPGGEVESVVLGHKRASVSQTSKVAKGPMLLRNSPLVYTRDGEGKGLTKTGHEPNGMKFRCKLRGRKALI
jgi:hypothetical protein